MGISPIRQLLNESDSKVNKMAYIDQNGTQNPKNALFHTQNTSFYQNKRNSVTGSLQYPNKSTENPLQKSISSISSLITSISQSVSTWEELNREIKNEWIGEIEDLWDLEEGEEEFEMVVGTTRGDRNIEGDRRGKWVFTDWDFEVWKLSF